MSSDFDDSKDTLVAHVGTVPAENGSVAITVDVKSYDGGPPKIRLNRTGTKKDGSAFTGKLGSIDAREARALASLLPKAADALEAAPVAAARKGRAPAKK
jgi:hypothetical protein